MKKIMVTLATFFVGVVNADTGGALFINSDNTEANLVINEGLVDGNLSKLFDQMKIVVTGTEVKKTKFFQMSNDRFSFVCNKSFFTNSLPSTSCTFKIKAGSNTGGINTFISQNGVQKVANIGMSQVFSKELNGVFPADPSGLTGYLLKIENSVTLEADGASWGNFMIRFSGQ